MAKHKKSKSVKIPVDNKAKGSMNQKKKQKKLKKKLKQNKLAVAQPVASNHINIKPDNQNKTKKNKKKGKSSNQHQVNNQSTIVNKSNVADKNKSVDKEKKFGEVSSDSDPEPIEVDWSVGSQSDDVGSQDGWNDGASNDENQSTDEDLENSEDDIDEELDERELNSLLCKSGQNGEVSDEAEDDDSEEQNDEETDHSESEDEEEKSKPKVVKGTESKNKSTKPQTSKISMNTDPKINSQQSQSKKEKVIPQENAIRKKPDSSGERSILCWKTEKPVLEEIKKRTIELCSRTLHVAPVAPNCTLEALKRLAPNSTCCRLSYNPIKKECRRYAFLEFADTETANVARKSISGRQFAGRIVCASVNRLPFTNDLQSDLVDRKQLFITGLGSDVTKQDLSKVFPKAVIEYPSHKDGFHLGYAFANFVNDDVALESFQSVHKHVIRGRPIFVNYSIRPARPAENEKTKRVESKPADIKQTFSKPAVNVQAEKPKDVLSSKPSEVNKSDSTTASQASVPEKACEPLQKRPKVLIKPLSNEGSDDDNDDDQGSELLSKRGGVNPLDALFVRRTDTTTSTTTIDTHRQESILTKLLASKQKNKKADLAKDKKKKGASDEDGSSDEFDDKLLEGDEMSEEEDDVDLDEGSSDEDEDDGSDDEEDDDDAEEDDDGSSDDDEDDDEADGDDDDDESEADGSESDSNYKSCLFDKAPSKSEKAALAELANSSDEQAEEDLMTILQAKRGASKALKAAGSKRKWNVNFNKHQNAKKMKANVGNSKGNKPLQLVMPSDQMLMKKKKKN